MTRLRLFTLAAATLAALGGLAAGALSLMGGALDQAVAFTWPGLAAGIALALAAPGESVR